jgi:hypothetical protein
MYLGALMVIINFLGIVFETLVLVGIQNHRKSHEEIEFEKKMTGLQLGLMHFLHLLEMLLLMRQGYLMFSSTKPVIR